MTDKTSLSYKDAGVDIDAGDRSGWKIKGVVKKTRRAGSDGRSGRARCAVCIAAKYREPVSVSGTDGVTPAASGNGLKTSRHHWYDLVHSHVR
ncbi:hypothetical protein ACNKHV_15685 [Shigella flexneri]